ncbi:GTP--adenosylcobinamide-phosphate guanylyltransferase [Halorubrum sp. SD626R]|uniref:NTP transferase domain-containing protein n=1 Tax=Halorubrum TaxID=56688 RepID=UPI0010F6243A|nr:MULTISPECIES: NTP transferase domain-containing protein [Halorubrum]TKX77007.1 GTP--adenosylcobinamide-phosphate guanylyltransferase [Halorubrum sp. SD626R]
MCGGRGTRLGGDAEKPLVTVAGRPMVGRVLAALAESRIERVHAVVSPHATATRSHLAERAAARGDSDTDLRIVDAPGDGYVPDLRYALGVGDAADAETAADAKTAAAAADADIDTADPPVLTVAADLPLLDGEAVDRVLDAAESAASPSLTVCVPAARKRDLGVSADDPFEVEGRAVIPAGINVVGGLRGVAGDGADAPGDDPLDDAVHLTDDRRLAVNVNYPSDVRIAEALLAEGQTTR